jgi:hypothetical protein
VLDLCPPAQASCISISYHCWVTAAVGICDSNKAIVE